MNASKKVIYVVNEQGMIVEELDPADLGKSKEEGKPDHPMEDVGSEDVVNTAVN
jgi:hypothetical protein